MRQIKKAAVLLLALCLLLPAGCGGTPDEGETPPPSASEPPPPVRTPEPSPEQPSPEPSPAEPANPLSGLPMSEEQANARPVAIMLNNLKSALPQQGNSGADIIYEVVAEGGITRMLGVYQTAEGIGIIGSVRSARRYYIELALGHDAIFIHAGGSEEAYSDLPAWGVDNMDGVNGPYSKNGTFWRDQNRIEGKNYALEHSLVTSGTAIEEALAKSGFRLEHKDGYTSSMTFAADGTPAGGETAETVTVPFSSYKTGVFRYDAASGCYLAEEYGAPYVDGNTGAQISVTNVLVLRASIQNSGDSYGHMIVDLSGGDGWFACGGTLIPITWTKDGHSGQLNYYTQDGEDLTLGQGKSYVNIIGSSGQISYE